MDVRDAAESATLALEVVALVIMTAGIVWSLFRCGRRLVGGESGENAYRGLRQSMGRSILLGLEVLIAADIIRTVAVEPSLENVAALGLIVLIRTFLSFSLEIEIDGVPPWRRER